MNKKNNEPDFMPEVEELQEQIQNLRDRIDLVVQNKEKVRPKIFEKVKSGYESELTDLFEKLEPFKEKIETEINTMQEKVENLTSEIEALEEEMEEYQLRFLAKEFGEEEFNPKNEELDSGIAEKQALIQEHNESMSKFKTQLAFITGEPIEESEELEELDEESDEIVEDEESDEFGEESGEIEEDIEEDYEQMQSDADELISDTQAEHALDEPIEQVIEDGQEDEYIWTSIPILDVIEGDFAGESYPMDKERITVGRGPNNDIQLSTDTSVSRHHSQLTQEDNRYVLVDLESSNGTSVNGTRITRTYLRPNDEIMIGTSKMIIRPSKE